MRIYHFNSQAYSKVELLERANSLTKESEEWMVDIGKFICDWFDDKTFVEASTSGSTGKPKVIRLEKKIMKASAEKTNAFFSLDYNRTALLCLPAKYIGGKMMIVRALISGMNVMLVEPSSRPLQHLSPGSIDFCAMTPLQAANSVTEDQHVLQQIKQLIIGGAPISNQLEQDLLKMNQQVYATYGMTETVSHVALRKITDPKSSYFALPGITFGITEGEHSCLIINADHLSEDPIITTDIVALKSEAEFDWLGRADGILNSGGIKIIPEVVEQKISKILSEKDYFIGAVRDEKLGEKVVLIIEDGPWNSENVQDLRKSLKQTLQKFHIPKEIYFLDKFVRTKTGKIQRSACMNLLP